MEFKIESKFEAYELKKALKKELSIKKLIVEDLAKEERRLIKSGVSAEEASRTIGKSIASLKRDHKTGINLIQRINSLIDDMEAK